jgi:ankyrin repeat protein
MISLLPIQEDASMSCRKRVLRNVVVVLICAGIPVGLVEHLLLVNRHERALIAAVMNGDERQVKSELQWGVNPNTRDVPEQPLDWREILRKLLHRERLPNREPYAPALLLAERYGYHAIARLLLQTGADPNAKDNSGKRSLLLALAGLDEDPELRRYDVETILMMLAKKADPNTRDDEHTALEAALNHHERDVARQLILRGANVNAPDERGHPLLPLATFDLYLTGLMLSKGADVNAVARDGNTVLMAANENMTPLLLAHGAAIRAKNAGDSVLKVAGENGEAIKIRWLLRYGGDCTVAHNGGWDLLRWSVAQRQSDLVGYALSHGLAVNTLNNFRRTPLMFAAANGDIKTVRLLLAHDANVNAQDKAGMTALMYSAQEDRADVIQMLLHHGANPHLKDNEHKWTATQFAEHFGGENVAELFRTSVLPAQLPADTNPKGDAKPSRIRVDANRWLVRTPLTRKDDPNPSRYEVYKPYAFCLVDRAGQRGASIITHYWDRAPAMFAFQDVNGQIYVYVEEHEDNHPGGGIYLIKELKLFRKWSDVNRFGMDCVPQPHGGALINRYIPGHYMYSSWHNPRVKDGLVEVSRFRNGVVKELGTIDRPGE